MGKAKLAIAAGLRMLTNWMRNHPQQKCIIHFSDDELRALKVQMQKHARTWLSTNEALLGHLHPLMLEVFSVPATGIVGVQLPVNLRGKINGMGERAVGNNVTLVSCVYDLESSEKSLPAQIHEEMRKKIAEDVLVKTVQFGNRTWDCNQLFMFKDLKPRPGVIDQWNYQVTTPFFDVDFGIGKPTRAQPWSLEPVKVMQSLHGGVDVMIHRTSIASWAKDQHGAVNTALSVSQLTLLGILWWRRETTSKQQLLASGTLFAMCMWGKKVLSKMHERYVDLCFMALEEHPRLRTFTQ